MAQTLKELGWKEPVPGQKQAVGQGSPQPAVLCLWHLLVCYRLHRVYAKLGRLEKPQEGMVEARWTVGDTGTPG